MVLANISMLTSSVLRLILQIGCLQQSAISSQCSESIDVRIKYYQFYHLNQHLLHSDTEAFVNLIKCTFGTGVLALPRAYYNSGWVLGLVGSMLIPTFILYAMHVLVVFK